MLLGVVELRAKDWGRMEPDPRLNPQQANPYLNQNPAMSNAMVSISVHLHHAAFKCLVTRFSHTIAPTKLLQTLTTTHLGKFQSTVGARTFFSMFQNYTVVCAGIFSHPQNSCSPWGWRTTMYLPCLTIRLSTCLQSIWKVATSTGPVQKKLPSTMTTWCKSLCKCYQTFNFMHVLLLVLLITCSFSLTQ